MVLYHGSNMAVEQPDLNHSKTNLDFGAGFYTTSDLDQAKRWAVSTTKRRGTGESTVTIYRVNSTLWRPMAVQRFASPNKAWLDYITVNRKRLPDDSAWDIVIGPVANDDTQQTIGIYLSGIITEKMCIQLLKPHKLKNQYTFKTEQAIATLEFRDVIRNWQ